MRAAVVLVLVMVGGVNLLEAGPRAPRTSSHVRCLSPVSESLLAEAIRRSPFVRDELERLEQTDVIAYLSITMAAAGAPAGHMRFLTTAGGLRYVVIEIDKWQSTSWEQICLLGHELQHALELAASPDVRDEAAFERLYRHIGYKVGQGKYETLMAKAATEQVRSDLRSRPR